MDNERLLRARAAQTLKKLPIFFGMEDEEYSHLVKICHGDSFQSGDCIFREGDVSDSLYVILNGKIIIQTSRSGLISELGVGDIFGEIGVICQVHRTADAIADAATTVLRIAQDDLVFLLGKHARMSSILMKNLAQVLAERLVAKNSQQSTYFA